MKDIAELKRILIAGLLILLINNLCFASDLIEPTRALSSPAEKAGKLSIFSEPPGIDVNMDGTQIGKTPVVGQKVEPGIYVIRVKDSETEINAEPGKLTKISWFKGAFIEIPAEVAKSRKQQSEEKKEVPLTRMSEQPAEKKEKPDPLYWPLNPKGPIN